MPEMRISGASTVPGNQSITPTNSQHSLRIKQDQPKKQGSWRDVCNKTILQLLRRCVFFFGGGGLGGFTCRLC